MWIHLLVALLTAPVSPLPQAHAHNDYEHARPLFDALDQGYCSVEADIWLVDGDLLVAHNRSQVKPERTLRALYLDPLRERVRANGGQVHPGGPSQTLLLDIKSAGAETYALLRGQLAEYREMLTETAGDVVIPRAVTVVLSGNCPRDAVLADAHRWAGIDGRLADLDAKLPSQAMPLISDTWTATFRWRGEGAMPDAERAKLRDIVQRAHDRGRRVRFWATPHAEALWRELLDAGVDLIGADDLARLRAFLLAQPGQ